MPWLRVLGGLTRGAGHGVQVVSLDDYNKYCFYVAGLVGVGLSRLFTAGGASQPKLGSHPAC